MKVLGFPDGRTMQVYVDWCAGCALELSGWCGGCETCLMYASPKPHTCAQGESSPYPKKDPAKMTTLEQHILMSRLNNGPKKRANGKPMSYRDEVLEAKDNVIQGEIISTDD